MNFGIVLACSALLLMASAELVRAFMTGKCHFVPLDADKSKFPVSFWINVTAHIVLIAISLWGILSAAK